ncbi:uncharacterized protein LOC122370948 [Amphibalanus amphitrite]|uniref:uncharacterized protein LOC122370948 n=1 Tax=Amphibalanus amphitrite TaxID=1232801 RepID=UPI001C91ECBD|nr:uncharacterized protein LOC122370948 [Amphibalanus amphitrite]XP_043202874.1 uncharacterized protein LOC122370948 [Amphibalanus amphitrite]
MRFSGALILLAVAVACLLAVAAAVPQGYGKPKEGRVKIQAYRGPNQHKVGDGYHQEYFAPFGYYVQQPEDDKPKYH